MADYAILLRDHVTLTCWSVDRIFLQAYVPKLQSVGWVCRFLRWQRGYEIVSSAVFGKIGETYVAEIHRWAKAPHGRVVTGRWCCSGSRRRRRRCGGLGRPRARNTPRIRTCSGVGEMAFVNHFYLYLWVPEWGAAFWKTNAYAPWPVWIWLNAGATGPGSATALDNGFRSCEDPEGLQRICDRLGPGAVKSFSWRVAASAALSTDPGGPARGLGLRAGVSPVRGLRHAGCSTGPRPGGRSSSSSSATTSTWVGRSRCR